MPAYASLYLAKAGLTWRVEQRVKSSFTAVSSATQYWQDSNRPILNRSGLDQSGGAGASFIPAHIPAYTVLDVAGDWRLNRAVRLLAGVSNSPTGATTIACGRPGWSRRWGAVGTPGWR